MTGHQGLPGQLTIGRHGLAVARVRPDGSLDPGFGDAGIARLEEPYDSFFPRDVLVTPEGEVLVAGEVYRHREGYRTTAGRGSSCASPTRASSTRRSAPAAAPTRSGRRDVRRGVDGARRRGPDRAGRWGPDSSFAVGRLLPNGSLDDTFGDRGPRPRPRPGYEAGVAAASRSSPTGGSSSVGHGAIGTTCARRSWRGWRGATTGDRGLRPAAATDETGGTLGEDGAAPTPRARPGPPPPRDACAPAAPASAQGRRARAHHVAARHRRHGSRATVDAQQGDPARAAERSSALKRPRLGRTLPRPAEPPGQAAARAAASRLRITRHGPRDGAAGATSVREDLGEVLVAAAATGR